MKYLLLYNIEELSKNIFLKSYIDEGFEVILDSNNCISKMAVCMKLM